MKDKEIQAQYRAELEALKDERRVLSERQGENFTNWRYAGNMAVFIEKMAGSHLYKLAVLVDGNWDDTSIAETQTDAGMLDVEIATFRNECIKGFEAEAITEAEGLPDFSDMDKAINAMFTEMHAAYGQAIRAYRFAQANTLPAPEVLRHFDGWNPHDDDQGEQ